MGEGREGDIPVSSGKGENLRCRKNFFDWWDGGTKHCWSSGRGKIVDVGTIFSIDGRE